ncbi:hypothetical protein BaRGS_00003733 [Batillaria attramentaria]|uniref:Integrase zinc-binding domain-containing protein n=1 Tax=Batillaria attramentaria TaxID=370345 RepID=A0ABD0M0B6_9CAEN
MRFKDINGQLARWLEELAQYDMKIVHRKGKDHINADVLSRLPDSLEACDCYTAGQELQSLPCGGCRYCTRAHAQWARFEEDVEDVLPLAVRVREIDAVDWNEIFHVDQLQKAQKEDTDLVKVTRWLLEECCPKREELSLQFPSVRALWARRKFLSVEDGLLKYTWVTELEEKKLVVVPKSLQKVALNLAHDNVTAGHVCAEKTLQRLRQSFFWINQKEIVICGWRVVIFVIVANIREPT